MTKVASARDPFEFSLRAVRIAAPVGPIPVVSDDHINQAYVARKNRQNVQKRSLIREVEDFLARYFAAGHCLAR